MLETKLPSASGNKHLQKCKHVNANKCCCLRHIHTYKHFLNTLSFLVLWMWMITWNKSSLSLTHPSINDTKHTCVIHLSCLSSQILIMQPCTSWSSVPKGLDSNKCSLANLFLHVFPFSPHLNLSEGIYLGVSTKTCSKEWYFLCCFISVVICCSFHM